MEETFHSVEEGGATIEQGGDMHTEKRTTTVMKLEDMPGTDGGYESKVPIPSLVSEFLRHLDITMMDRMNKPSILLTDATATTQELILWVEETVRRLTLTKRDTLKPIRKERNARNETTTLPLKIDESWLAELIGILGRIANGQEPRLSKAANKLKWEIVWAILEDRYERPVSTLPEQKIADQFQGAEKMSSIDWLAAESEMPGSESTKTPRNLYKNVTNRSRGLIHKAYNAALAVKKSRHSTKILKPETASEDLETQLSATTSRTSLEDLESQFSATTGRTSTTSKSQDIVGKDPGARRPSESDTG
ncbi:MAG: hypothetical protein LQ338_007766 [Usnochroma carphineum]|nr:MAG: hypothetical protein LQ338_007766 [Usnochroma carphineum]